MISIKNIRTPTGEVANYQIPSEKDQEIIAKESWLLLPGLVDPHICLGPSKERERFLGIEAAILGGVTTALETPIPPLSLPDTSLFDLPLHQGRFWLAQDPHRLDPLLFQDTSIKGIVIDPTPSSPPLSDPAWGTVFRLAAQHDCPLLTRANSSPFVKAVLRMVEQWGNRLLMLDIRQSEQVDWIQAAQQRALLVYGEVSVHTLFSSPDPISKKLWQALHEKVIELVGSGYVANQQAEERIVYRGTNVSAYSPLFSLPQMLQAVEEGKMSVEKCVEVMSLFAQDFFRLPKRADFIIIDFAKQESIHRYLGRETTLATWKGWPVCTILGGKLFFPPSSGYPQPDEFLFL